CPGPGSRRRWTGRAGRCRRRNRSGRATPGGRRRRPLHVARVERGLAWSVRASWHNLRGDDVRTDARRRPKPVRQGRLGTVVRCTILRVGGAGCEGHTSRLWLVSFVATVPASEDGYRRRWSGKGAVMAIDLSSGTSVGWATPPTTFGPGPPRTTRPR